MDHDLQQQYSAMISNVIADNTEGAKAVLSNILSAKLASRLQAHNMTIAQLNQTALTTNNVPPIA